MAVIWESSFTYENEVVNGFEEKNKNKKINALSELVMVKVVRYGHFIFYFFLPRGKQEEKMKTKKKKKNIPYIKSIFVSCFFII